MVEYLIKIFMTKELNNMNEELAKWCKLTKKQNEIYHQCAKDAKLSDAQFWVLYALCEVNHPLCQNTFCEQWCYSKQTINTAVSTLQKTGLVSLTFAKGSRKKKDINLTAKGEQFCDKYIRSVMHAECKVINDFSEKERQQFFSFLEKLLSGIEKELNK